MIWFGRYVGLKVSGSSNWFGSGLGLVMVLGSNRVAVLLPGSSVYVSPKGGAGQYRLAGGRLLTVLVGRGAQFVILAKSAVELVIHGITGLDVIPKHDCMLASASGVVSILVTGNNPIFSVESPTAGVSNMANDAPTPYTPSTSTAGSGSDSSKV